MLKCTQTNSAESSRRYDQNNPSDAEHVLRTETCYCQVLSEVTGDRLWLCDLTMQIIVEKKEKSLNEQVCVCVRVCVRKTQLGIRVC